MLDESELVEGHKGPGSTEACVKVFPSESEAIKFAADILRTHLPADGWEEMGEMDDDDLLDEFQSSLNGFEYFRIYPVVD